MYISQDKLTQVELIHMLIVKMFKKNEINMYNQKYSLKLLLNENICCTTVHMVSSNRIHSKSQLNVINLSYFHLISFPVYLNTQCSIIFHPSLPNLPSYYLLCLMSFLRIKTMTYFPLVSTSQTLLVTFSPCPNTFPTPGLLQVQTQQVPHP